MQRADPDLAVAPRHVPPPSDRRARVLVTNDDGIAAPGLEALVAALVEDHEVVVVAPTRDVSGAGTGIGRIDPQAPPGLRRCDDLAGAEAWAIDGPPGLAVMSAALGAFGPRPDLVASGINAGMNTGASIVHSGTVGAAVTARTFGIPGLAVSLAPGERWRYATAGPVARAALGWLRGRAALTTLNVNVPGVAPGDVRGARWATIDAFGHFRLATRGEDGSVLDLDVHDRRAPRDPDSDTAGVLAGWVTLTALGPLGAAPVPDDDPRDVAGTADAEPR